MKKIGAIGGLAMLAGVAIGQTTAPSSQVTTKLAAFGCSVNPLKDQYKKGAMLEGMEPQGVCYLQFNVLNKKINAGRVSLGLDKDGNVIGKPKATVPAELKAFVKSFYDGKFEPMGEHLE